MTPEPRLRIEVPMLPPAVLSPNSRVHWSERHKGAKEFKAAVYVCAISARNGWEQAHGLRWAALPKARINVTAVYDCVRGRDPDNLIASLKPACDALTPDRNTDYGAAIVQGDDAARLSWGTVTMEVDASRSPLTVLEVEAQP